MFNILKVALYPILLIGMSIQGAQPNTAQLPAVIFIRSPYQIHLEKLLAARAKKSLPASFIQDSKAYNRVHRLTGHLSQTFNQQKKL